MKALPRLALVVLMLSPVTVAAQQVPPPDGRGGGRDQGEPGGPRMDSFFFLGQVMRAINEKADILLETRQTDAAIQELRRVFTVDVPKDSPVYELKAHLIGRLAGVYAANARKTEALDTVKALLKEVGQGSPAEAAAWLDAGTTYRALGMTAEALNAFDRAIELSNQLAKNGWQDRKHPPGGGPHGRPGGGPPGQPMPDGSRQP